jgi:hypothetical protein
MIENIKMHLEVLEDVQWIPLAQDMNQRLILVNRVTESQFN